MIESIETDHNAEPFLEPVMWQGKILLIYCIELGLLDYP